MTIKILIVWKALVFWKTHCPIMRTQLWTKNAVASVSWWSRDWWRSMPMCNPKSDFRRCFLVVSRSRIREASRRLSRSSVRVVELDDERVIDVGQYVPFGQSIPCILYLPEKLSVFLQWRADSFWAARCTCKCQVYLTDQPQVSMMSLCFLVSVLVLVLVWWNDRSSQTITLVSSSSAC